MAPPTCPLQVFREIPLLLHREEDIGGDPQDERGTPDLYHGVIGAVVEIIAQVEQVHGLKKVFSPDKPQIKTFP